MREVKFDNLTLSYLYDLAKLLFDKEYFSFVETADKYIDDIIVFILKNIHTFPHKKAPAYFSKYGKICFTFPTTETKEQPGTLCLKKQTLIS
ncbi:MAG: hypothetical protein WDA08_02865 [Weeksellaceae bacterium]